MKAKPSSTNAQNAGTSGENTGSKSIGNAGTISVIVKPNGRKNEVVGYSSEKKSWLINIKAVAEKDKANRELLKFLKKETGRSWMIKSGRKSRDKILIATSS